MDFQVREMPLHRVDHLIDRLSVRRWIGAAKPGKFRPSINRAGSNVGAFLMTCLIKQKKEGDVVSEHDNLPMLSFLG